MTTKTIAVIGCTGSQGGGTVHQLLSNSNSAFKVRGITTNLNSSRAQALSSKYVTEIKEGKFELIEGNLNDQESLENALKGCQGLFAAWGPGPAPKGDEVAEEVVQGNNLVNAAKAVGIEHFVYSSLESLKEKSEGRFPNAHYRESKVAVEKSAKANLRNVTILIPGAFYANLNGPGWARRESDGSVVFCAPFRDGIRLPWVDASFDIGNFARAIFERGEDATRNKTYLCASTPAKSLAELAQEYREMTGEKVSVSPLSTREGGALTARGLGIDSSIGKELEDTYEFFNEALAGLPADYPAAQTDQAFEELGVVASTFSQFIERTGWRAPRFEDSH